MNLSALRIFELLVDSSSPKVPEMQLVQLADARRLRCQLAHFCAGGPATQTGAGPGAAFPDTGSPPSHATSRAMLAHAARLERAALAEWRAVLLRVHGQRRHRRYSAGSPEGAPRGSPDSSSPFYP